VARTDVAHKQGKGGLLRATRSTSAYAQALHTPLTIWLTALAWLDDEVQEGGPQRSGLAQKRLDSNMYGCTALHNTNRKVWVANILITRIDEY
jgi:hypothetical protein